MLQLNAIVCIMSTKFTSRLYWRFTTLFSSNSMRSASEFSTMALKQNHVLPSSIKHVTYQKNFETLKEKVLSSLISKLSNTSIIHKLQQANNIDELLKLINVPNLTEAEISTVMKAIISWVNENNKANTDKENKIENVNNRTDPKYEKATSKNNLKTSIDDSLLKYKDLSTSSMIQEVLKLAKEKKRQIKELNYLLEGIRKFNEKINVHDCSSLLYSMATLKYIDMELCNLISETLIKNIYISNITVTRSVLYSMAKLRYKNVKFLKHICQLIINSGQLYPTHILNIIQSLAMLGFVSKETDTVIKRYLPVVTIDLLGIDNWLNFVWCLVLLNNVQKSHIASVLSNEFIRTLFTADAQKDVLQQIKLLNINGAAKYLATDYDGPLLEKDIIQNEVAAYSKEKQKYVLKLEKTLNFMSQSQNCFRSSVNTGMGFLLDAECYVNSNFNFVDLNTAKNDKINKLAIIINDYNAYCHGNEDTNGIVKFQKRLLNHSGYKVISISYKHFGLEDNLVKLTSLLTSRIKVS
ncbi:uncharacterized protein LOC116434031 isoform X1 [Nomia melanderi]|uniref:uncharacterized protein LOC116434031 isoform X1 n=1 Tax=Nomia melanderi TaxID=2448451 RepID=UPI003FCC53D7